MVKQERRFYEFGPYRLLPGERLLLREGQPIALTPKAFELLVVLVERGGRVVEKDELLSEVWAGTIVEESNIAQNVFALRRALGLKEDGRQYIETVPKRGYRFLAGVRVLGDYGGELLLRPGMRAEELQHQEEPPTSDIPNPPSLDSAHKPDSASFEGAPSDLTLSQEEQKVHHVSSTTGARELSEQAAGLVAGPWRKPILMIGALTLGLGLIGLGVVIARFFFNRTPSPPPNVIKLSRLMSGMRIWSAAISPDGRHVAHVVENSGQTSIWVRQVATTTDFHIIPPDHGAFYWGLTFSPEGDYLYYLRQARYEPASSLYRVPALGGVSRKIASDIHSLITASPDGKQIAFVRDVPGSNMLVIANVDGTGERRLAVRERPDFFSGGPRGGPSWSPDGRTIATGLISMKGGYHGELISVSVTDGSDRPLTSRRWYQVAQVAWLADGSGLLVAARESSIAQIWHVGYPDGTVRQITHDFNDYHGVSLTADARMLATVQFDRPSTIAFVPEKPPSMSPRNTAGMNEGFYGMSWTPDDSLVYAAEVGGNLDIWLMGPDGVSTEQLTTDTHHDSTPSVSPDGRSVVFVSTRDGEIAHIWRMNIDGGDQRRLTNQGGEGTPSFTPDGRWVVYSASDGIWKVPADGGQPVQISGGYLHTPSLSPDGSLIACIYRDEKAEGAAKLVDKIAIVPFSGGSPVKVMDEPEANSSATIRWTTNGRALYYVATRYGVSNLWTLPLDGTAPRAVTNFNFDLVFNFAWSRDNKQLALARGTTAEHVVLVSDFR
jgi:Tol biopolymer transport system component/DNA-binding winged helix-turn-helix (wHTH) protein